MRWNQREYERWCGRSLTVIVEGERRGFTGDDLAVPAEEFRNRFVTWLAANQPDLGITTETEWIGTVVKPGILVVMHCMFFSEEWEMGLRWHVMIPPHDWVEIYLRHRTTEVFPSHAFKIPSLTAGDEPQAVDPSEMLWR